MLDLSGFYIDGLDERLSIDLVRDAHRIVELKNLSKEARSNRKAPSEMIQKYRKWIKENCEGDYTFTRIRVFKQKLLTPKSRVLGRGNLMVFENEEDAMAFTLRWM